MLDYKSLVSAIKFKCDLYQKSNAAIEGIAEKTIIRLDNNSIFTGTKFTMKDANVTAESYSVGSILAETTISFAASDKAEISLIWKSNNTINRFSEEAKLIKKIK